MILHHVAQGAGGFIVTGPALHSECFGSSDLDVIDVTRVPDRLKNRVGETENQNVLRRFFAEKMVDPVSLVFTESVPHDPIQFARGSEIAAKRLFNDDACPTAFLWFV